MIVYHIVNHVLILAKYGRIPKRCWQHLRVFWWMSFGFLLHSLEQKEKNTSQVPRKQVIHQSSTIYWSCWSGQNCRSSFWSQFGWVKPPCCLGNCPLPPHLLPRFASAGSVRRSAQSLMKACPVSTKIKQVSRSTFLNRWWSCTNVLSASRRLMMADGRWGSTTTTRITCGSNSNLTIGLTDPDSTIVKMRIQQIPATYMD